MSTKRKPRPTPIETPVADPPATGVIPTLELLAVITHRRALETLQSQIRTIAAMLAEAEARVMTLHEAGARPEDPRFNVAVLREDGSIAPKWKAEHLTHMAEVHGASPVAVEEEVRSHYKPNVMISLVIEVKE